MVNVTLNKLLAVNLLKIHFTEMIYRVPTCLYIIIPVIIIITYTWHLTLYVPRLLTTHGREASLPSDTVTFGIGSAKFGSSVNTVNKRKTKYKLVPSRSCDGLHNLANIFVSFQQQSLLVIKLPLCIQTVYTAMENRIYLWSLD